MNEKDKQELPPFWSVVVESLIEGEKAALRFARAGAIVGALLGAGLGFFLISVFGVLGIGVGLVAGAAVGGIGAWFMYQTA